MHPFIVLLARLGLGGLWLAAGAAKLAKRGRQPGLVSQFGIRPAWAAERVAAGLPWMELALGILLIAGLRLGAAASASAVLLAVFSVAVGVNLLQGRRFECGCFGQTSRGSTSWWTVVRNAGLLAVAVVIIVEPHGYLAVDGWIDGGALRPGEPPALDFVPVLLMALAGAGICACLRAGWAVAKAVALAPEGPALRMPERHLLRRLLSRRLSDVTLTESEEIGVGR